MGFDFTGHVLRAPRVAPGNAVTSSEPLNGVVRDVRIPPVSRVASQPEVEGIPGTPKMVDLAGDQYRAAILDAPGTSPHEYLVWAAYSGQIARVEGPDWWVAEGTGRIPVGDIPITADPDPVNDGATKVIITDNGGRQIGNILYLVIARGDEQYKDKGWVDPEDPTLGRKGSEPYPVVKLGVVDQNPIAGIATLTNENVFTSSGGTLTASNLDDLFGGGLSLSRGDRIVGVRYTLAAVKFWWTRNDRYETRFGWSSKFQRWMPYKGTGPVNLGRLLFDETYTLSPPLSNLPVGAVLPGDATIGDGYAMVRLGTSAGALSIPVGTSDPYGFTGIVVVSDVEAASQYDFSGVNYAGVVGQTNGVLQFNTAFVRQYAGNPIWYIYRGFTAEADGVVGGIGDELFVTPIPGATDHPFIKINNRTPLNVILADNEAALDELNLVEGSCGIALTTGRLKLAALDVAKSDPESHTFDKHFLGARIIYDGVALNARPQPIKAPVALVQSDGVTRTMPTNGRMYLPEASIWPEDLSGSDVVYRGLGVSGVLYLPDGTGSTPQPEGVDPFGLSIPVRPGGDTLGQQSLGLVRHINDGISDLILFSKASAISDVVVTNSQSDVPGLMWWVPGGSAYISREGSNVGGTQKSLVQFGFATVQAWANQEVYFLQASINPAIYTEVASIQSKNRLVFRFDGTEVLYFAIDGTAHTWASSSLLVTAPDREFFDASAVAASIQAQILADGGTGVCIAFGDRVVLESGDLSVVGLTVEIGWGNPKDLSGAASLGFLPGWVAETGKPNWLSDAGISLGVSRSLLNLDRVSPDSDYYARYRLEDVVLSQSVQAAPFTFLDFPPVEDVAGYDEGVFFNIQAVAIQGDEVRVIDKRLGHYEEIEHRFFEGKFAWLGSKFVTAPVLQRTSTLNLGSPAVVPSSLLGAPGINGALMAAENGARFVAQQPKVDYILPEEGQSGTVQLIVRYGARVARGGLGQYTAGSNIFSDTGGQFLTRIKAGDRIKLASGASAGSYIVQSVSSDHECLVVPLFPATADQPTPWEAYSGYPDSVYDPAVVADQVYKPFNHLPEEPFRILVLSPLGEIDTGRVDFTASVEDANASGRLVGLRFGPVHSSPGSNAVLTPVSVFHLGTIANNVLVMPQTTHVTEAAFSIRVGTELFRHDSDLVPVAVFSGDPVSIEYLTSAWGNHLAGELKFNSAMLLDLESSAVTLVEELRSSANLDVGQAEYDPRTGAVRISDVDGLVHEGKQLYLTEQMVTVEPGADVNVSPLVGGVSFRKPVARGCLVEMEYWRADVEGRRVGTPEDTVIEFLPVFVRRETATRLRDNEFQVDSTGSHVIDTRIEPVVHIGPMQQNFGKTDFTVDRPAHLKGMRLAFDRDLPEWVAPEVSYAVFDALGGERAYTTSQRPVYRPPFFIKAGKDNFGLRGNRVADFEVGQMLRIGPECFYITGLRYFSGPDTTRVDIFPSTVMEVGSRSPGNDVLTLVTSGPITPVIGPDGSSPVLTNAPEGFMQEVPTTDFPFEPVNAKQNSITFLGDLSAFAVPGHIMEVGGTPFTIASAVLSGDGTRTKLTFTSPFRLAMVPNGTTVRLSYRPVYPPETRQFVGVGPFVASEGVELVLFGEFDGGIEKPGRTLAEGSEFQIDPESGAIVLVEPLQAPLGPGQRLMLSFTKIRVLEPFLDGGSVQFPRWLAKFKHNVLPDTDNGYLGGVLTASYTFENPDSFYYRVLPLRRYLGEAVKQAVVEMKQGQSSNGGPSLSMPPGDNNWEKGNQSLHSKRRELLDKDRAARSLLTFYNGTVVAFEQVGECITGQFIGDRSGKLRFWIGRGREYAPPGYEDSITGVLNPSNVWNQVFNEDDPSRDIQFNPETDLLVHPKTSSIVDLRLTGWPMGASSLRRMMERQRLLVRNDVDDVLLIGSSKSRVRQSNSPPYFNIESRGSFARMGSVHRYSRLFPTTTNVAFTLLPGIGTDMAVGNVGTYSWGKVNPETGETERTHGEQIGQVANPVLGDITNISGSRLRLRLPRTRVSSYYPNGIVADAFFPGSVAITKPCFIVSMVPLSDLPIDPDTGKPDVSRFLSQDPQGDTPDAQAGHPLMALPGFQSGQKIGWGKPDGRFLAALYPEELDLFGAKLYTSVFVDEVLYGCVLTFKNRQGDAITSPYDLLVGLTASTGVPAHLFPIERSDTIYVLPPDADNPISDPESESLTLETMQQAALLMPMLRQGMDIAVDADGRVIDLSLPSWEDPFFFPLKESVGQKTPDPLSHLEGSVDFANTRQLPLNVPALLGEPFNDAGDVSIPYLKGTNTELDRFSEITTTLGPLMDVVPGGGGAYPDEILTLQGEVVDSAVVLGGGFNKEPGTLMLPVNVEPLGTYGVAPAQEGDFLIIELDPGNPEGWQGFLTIGRVRNTTIGGQPWSWLEPPRFVTQVNTGSQVQYLLENYAVHTTPNQYDSDPQVFNPIGARLYEDLAGGLHIISLQDTTITLNDGFADSTGNLNTILAANPDNVVRVKLLARPDATATDCELPLGIAGFTLGEQDGRVLVEYHITAATLNVVDFQGNSLTGGPVAHGGVLFGVYDAVTLEPDPGAVANRRHIIFVGLPVNSFGFSPTTAVPPGAPAAWYLPHTVTATLKASIYGYEYALSIDTSAGASVSCSIGTDRLTFSEVVDFTHSVPRDFEHEIGPLSYPTTLHVQNVETALGLEPINDVIGGPLSFVSREPNVEDSIQGTWVPGAAGTELGSVRVMGFETAPNVSVVASDVVVSVVPSQAEDTDGDAILEGTGLAEHDRLSSIIVGVGGIDRVQKGDVVYIDCANHAQLATSKAGTYLVRHVVEPNVLNYKRVGSRSFLGTGGGFIVTVFPRILSLDVLGQRLAVDDYSPMPPSGKLYVLLDETKLNSTDIAIFQRAAFSVDFTGFDVDGIILGAAATWRWADDSIIAGPDTEIIDAMVMGKQLSWHNTPVGGAGPSSTGVLQINVRVRGGSLPDDSSVVGIHSVGVGVDDAVFGFHELTYARGGNVASTLVADIKVGDAPLSGEVAVEDSVAVALHSNYTFDPTNSVAVYPEVPVRLSIHLSDADGGVLNDPHGHLAGAPGVSCLFPGTDVRIESAVGEPTFYALGGIFLEPSFPMHTVNLGGTPNIVDSVRSMNPGTVGMLNPAVQEDVHFEVRRCRRWHGQQEALNDAFRPLQFAYEIRRGRVTDFTRDPQQVGLVTASSFIMDWGSQAPDVWNDGSVCDGTNLGPFNSSDVNINPGDVFRLLDDDGNLLDDAVITEVVSDSELRLQAPAFASMTEAEVKAGGRRFEIYLRQAPVPHEQSNEQLLDIIVDRVVFQTVADRTDPDPQNWVGGYVPDVGVAGDWADMVNKLYDDSASAPNFLALGVRAGDIVIIDPAGTLPVVDEQGHRPLGDRSVPTRTSAGGGPVPYDPGQVSSLDDNRGFYRVLEVAADHLTLDPVHSFAGTLGEDVVFGGDSNIEYAIYPTVSVSAFTDPATGEGQNDLRPTRKAVGETYTDFLDLLNDKHSIRPFSYRIVRPNAMFGSELVDTVLMMRERMLSLIELFRSSTTGVRGGFYWDWQNDEHILDLGDPSDPGSGKGLFPNRQITTLVGETSHSPFINTNDCLSLLDRRFWVLDHRLDSIRPDPNNPFGVVEFTGVPDPVYPEVGGPYTAYTDPLVGTQVRPVLPDHISLILDIRDRLRAIRYTWLTYRTHRFTGTLAQIAAFDSALPGKLEERKRTVILERTAAEVP